MTWNFVVRLSKFIDNSTRVTDTQLQECVEGLCSREQIVAEGGGMTRKLGRKACIGEKYLKKGSIKKNMEFLLNAVLE